MKKQEIKIDIDFSWLLTNLGDDTSQVCLLNGSGGGWTHRIAWNPCDSYVLNNSQPFQSKLLYEFISKHQDQGHLIVGFVSYDLGYSLNDISRTKKDELNLPDIVLYAYDNYLERVNDSVTAIYKNDAFVEYVSNISRTKSDVQRTTKHKLDFEITWDKKSYKKAFGEIKQYIYDGTLYQMNLTQRLEAKCDENPRILFDNMARKNTAKMMSYLEGSDFEIISMSPERFIRTNDKIIETTPIKGTRPRGKDEAEDDKNLRSLLADGKEKAELNMITDLLRNDLGKVCKTGSVEVADERAVEKLSSVMHTFSTVRGKLREDVSPIQALISMFPGGSITGCPKKKSMEIIDELEDSARSLYCGTMFVIGSDGNLDSSILIRTIIKKRSRLILSVGSGIVYDSVEEKEYQENLDKARPFF